MVVVGACVCVCVNFLGTLDGPLLQARCLRSRTLQARHLGLRNRQARFLFGIPSGFAKTCGKPLRRETLSTHGLVLRQQKHGATQSNTRTTGGRTTGRPC